MEIKVQPEKLRELASTLQDSLNQYSKLDIVKDETSELAVVGMAILFSTEYNVDTSKLLNFNNQATYYDKYGGG